MNHRGIIITIAAVLISSVSTPHSANIDSVMKEERETENKPISLAKICALKNNKKQKIDETGFVDKFYSENGLIIIEREIAPESLDWSAYDYYVLQGNNVKYFQRTFIYPNSAFSLQIIKIDGRNFDNRSMKPQYLYEADLPIYSSLEQLCTP